MYVTLNLIKKHLNIDSTFTEDDQYLTILEGVAEKTIQRNICCVLSDLEDASGAIPAPLAHSILLYIGILYNSREAVAYGGSPVEVPYTLEYLINLFKNYSDTTSDDFVYSVLDDIAEATRLVQEGTYEGDIIIDSDIKRKAVDRIASEVEINTDGEFVTGNIERI